MSQDMITKIKEKKRKPTGGRKRKVDSWWRDSKNT